VLLSAGADAQDKDLDQNNALILAAGSDNESAELMQTILRPGDNVDSRSRFGKTALMAAALRGKSEIVRFLLKNDADPKTEDGFGNTALLEAIKFGRIEVAEILLATGLDVNEFKHGMTPLMLAARIGGPKMVAFLLGKGANPNVKTKQGKTALEFVGNSGQADEVVRILEQAQGKK
jgi:ankyrin repeat protein